MRFRIDLAKVFARGCLLSALFFLSACFSGYQGRVSHANARRETVRSIAILPMNNFSTSAGAGRSAALILGQRWKTKQPKYELLSVDQVEARIREKHLVLPDIISRNKAVELGSILNVDVILLGEVLEYDRIPEARRRKVVYEPVVAIQMQALQVPEGKILWTAVKTGSSETLMVPSGQTQEDILRRIYDEVLAEISRE